jgi:hypothetical protein
MAQLNSSNVSNGNIIQPNDILQLYDAFTAGGGTTGAYEVSISGSLTGSATSASYALSASSVISASYALSSSYAVSSSRAVTSSLALITSTLNAPISPSGSEYSTVPLGVIAGSLTAAGGIATTPISDPLKGKVIGTSLFVNATIFAPGGSANSVGVRSYNAGTGQIEFQTGGGTGTEFIMFTAYYRPS